MPNEMNWDDFRYFLALARQGTISAAGRELKVKHTTVARRIKTFEEDLGSRLFDHTKHGYALTQAGENLYQHALIIEEQTQTVGRQILGMDTRMKGVVNISAAYDVLNRLVVPHLKRFKERYPDIDLQLHASPDLVDLSMGNVDIAIRLTGNPPGHLVGREIMKLRHGFYASQKYLKCAPTPHKVVVWRDDPQPQWQQDYFPEADTSLKVDHIAVLTTALKNNLGIGRLPCLLGDSEAGLKRLDIELPESDWGVWVLSHIDLRATARVRATREFLYEVIEEQKHLIHGEQSKYFS